MMDSEPKNYEVAYLLSPAVPEDEALAQAGKISGVIEEEKGVIRRVETPRKRKLAYPVAKERQAYFGLTAFVALPSVVTRLEKKIKDIPEILRHLTVEEEIETRRPIILRQIPSRLPAGGPKPAIPREPEKPEEKLDLEALDKRLEEILGK